MKFQVKDWSMTSCTEIGDAYLEEGLIGGYVHEATMPSL